MTLTESVVVWEYWTESRTALVVDGTPDVIRRIAVYLDVPVDDIILITLTRAVLGIWGSALTRYTGSELSGRRWVRRERLAWEADGNRDLLAPHARQEPAGMGRHQRRDHMQPQPRALRMPLG